MAPQALAQVLRPLATLFPPERFPKLLVGLGEAVDDAAVYKITDEVALIATLDFFTPVVDDPFSFGAIAAANALSDIYAMGGDLALALNICCLSECLPVETIEEILRGGASKVAEAGGALVGGHSVDDKEPKYGLCALGFVHPERVFRKAGAQVGDALVLTKPLGVGIITTVLKADEAEQAHIDAAVTSMLRLNRAAAGLFRDSGIRCCTDVTGFALLGHSTEMAGQGGVTLRYFAGDLPFHPGAAEYADMWLFPAGTTRNQQAFGGGVSFDEAVAEETQQLLFTPETSGGLLAAVPADALAKLQAAFKAADEPLWVVGEVVPRQETTLVEVKP
jgi:selenide,water dikinase